MTLLLFDVFLDLENLEYTSLLILKMNGFHNDFVENYTFFYFWEIHFLFYYIEKSLLNHQIILVLNSWWLNRLKKKSILDFEFSIKGSDVPLITHNFDFSNIKFSKSAMASFFLQLIRTWGLLFKLYYLMFLVE